MARIKVVERTTPNKAKAKKSEKGINKEKKSKIKKAKKKIKKEKEVIIAPRSQLEPRLTPKPDAKGPNKTSEQTSSVEKHEIQQNGSLEQMEDGEIILPDVSNFDAHLKRKMLKNYNSVQDIKFEIPEIDTDYVDFEVPRPAPQRQKRIYSNSFWKDRELLDLATGLQSYGFQETKKIAEMVKTRSENEIREFIKRRTADARKVTKTVKNQGKGRPLNCWSRVSPENLPTWPHVRKWRRMAYEQMLALVKIKDYSKPVLIAMLKRFYDEEEEPSDPQVINVKSIYKYLLDCMAGQMPAQLPPKESALLLDILKDLRLLPLVCDFNEEKKFLEKYTEATKYRPFQVKDEFKKRFCKDNPDELFGTKSVAVPEEMFANLSLHKRLVQSFNPLVVPVWMMQKEQDILEQLL